MRNGHDQKDGDLRGKVIVITGASSGFGKGAALKFADSGAQLVLAARRSDLLDEIVRDCEKDGAGTKAIAVQTDVSREDDVRKLAEAAIRSFSKIDVWVNNAGAGALGRFDEVPLDEHVQVIETDLLGTLYGSYFAMRQFRKQGYGTLINMASSVGKAPTPYFASYAAAKFGVVGLSASLREELVAEKVDSIHVCTVLPTSMDTPFFEHLANYTGHQSVPLGPVYDADKVVDVIVRLAREPEAEVAVGAAGVFMQAAHQIAPQLTEKLMARRVKKTIDKAPTGEPTRGSLQEPEPTGITVSGGWKKK